MSVSVSNTYSIGADAVLAHMLDDAYAKAKYEALGNRNFERLSKTTNGNVTTIKQKREVHTDVPSFAKKILSEWNTLEETYEWTDNGDSKSCKIDSQLIGQPVRISGDIKLTDTGGSCREDVAMEASVKIPLIGKKLQKKAEEDIATDLRRENEFNTSYFAN